MFGLTFFSGSSFIKYLRFFKSNKINYKSKEWINYEIASETLATLPWGKIYIGQTQKWFAFRFKGVDNEINVGTENPEFSEWKWSHHNLLVENIVPFKRNTYQKILEEFKDLFVT